MTDLFSYAAAPRAHNCRGGSVPGPVYPSVPGFKARQTASDAAQAMQGRAPRLRQLCVDQLTLAGPLTTDECASNMGVDKLSIRPRFSELAALGKIRDSGERRANGSGKRAIVWTLVR